jgi:protein SCO1/2
MFFPKKVRSDHSRQKDPHPGDKRTAWLPGLLLILLVACYPPAGAGAHESGVPPSARDDSGTPSRPEENLQDSSSPAGPAGEVGIDEKLGAAIPLDLTFRDENGRQVSLRQLITGPTIIAPVYYHCPDACDFLQGGLAQVLPGVKLKPGKDFQVLSVSFDEKETPAMAHKSKLIYMDAMQGRFPPEGWHFLTGDLGNIHALTDAAGFHFQRRGDDFLHPVGIFIVSGKGKIIRYLYGTSFLPMDLTLGLMEASAGRTGPTIRKLVRFCFSFDPQNKRYVFNIFRVSATVILLTAGAFLTFLVFYGRKTKSSSR